MFWIRLKRHRLFYQSLSLVIATQLITAQSLYSQPQTIPTPAQTPQVSGPIALLPRDILSLQVPESYGNIKQTSLGNQGKIIIHVQDSHVNYEAQTNIAHILDYLVRELTAGDKEGAPLPIITIEGAATKSDPQWFQLFPNEEVKKKVLDYYLKRGYISGPQFFQVFSKQPVSVIGVETPQLYLENLNFFRETYAHNKQILAHIEELKAALLAIRDKIFNQELLDLSQKAGDFHNNKIVLTDYVATLTDIADINNISLNNWNQLLIAKQAIALEKGIDYNQVNKERDKLITRLKNKLPKEDISELVTQSLYFRLGKITSLDYYNYLEGAAEQAEIQISLFSHLVKYIEALYYHQQIEGELLYNHLLGAEKQIKNALIKNNEERVCNDLIRRIQILEHLSKLELSREELKEYQENPLSFMIEEFLFFIEEKLSQLNLDIRLNPNVDEVNNYFETLEGFYRTAVARDQALMQNTLTALEKNDAQVAILVTGGFHTQGMVKLFEEANVSTMVISPRITEELDNTAYLNAMMNEHLPLARVLNRRGNRISQPLSVFIQQPITGNIQQQVELHSELVMLYLALAGYSSQDTSPSALNRLKNSIEQTVTEELPNSKKESFASLLSSIKGVEKVTVFKRNHGLTVEFNYQDKVVTFSIASQLVGEFQALYEAGIEKGELSPEINFVVANKGQTESILRERKEVAERTQPLRKQAALRETATATIANVSRRNIHSRRTEARTPSEATNPDEEIVNALLNATSVTEFYSALDQLTDLNTRLYQQLRLHQGRGEEQKTEELNKRKFALLNRVFQIDRNRPDGSTPQTKLQTLVDKKILSLENLKYLDLWREKSILDFTSRQLQYNKDIFNLITESNSFKTYMVDAGFSKNQTENAFDKYIAERIYLLRLGARPGTSNYALLKSDIDFTLIAEADIGEELYTLLKTNVFNNIDTDVLNLEVFLQTPEYFEAFNIDPKIQPQDLFNPDKYKLAEEYVRRLALQGKPFRIDSEGELKTSRTVRKKLTEAAEQITLYQREAEGPELILRQMYDLTQLYEKQKSQPEPTDTDLRKAAKAIMRLTEGVLITNQLVREQLNRDFIAAGVREENSIKPILDLSETFEDFFTEQQHQLIRSAYALYGQGHPVEEVFLSEEEQNQFISLALQFSESAYRKREDALDYDQTILPTSLQQLVRDYAQTKLDPSQQAAYSELYDIILNRELSKIEEKDRADIIRKFNLELQRIDLKSLRPESPFTVPSLGKISAITIVEKDRRLSERLKIAQISGVIKKAQKTGVASLSAKEKALLLEFSSTFEKNKHLLYKLIEEGTRYPFVPELKTIDQAFAHVAFQLENADIQPGEVRFFDLTELLSKVTNLKELNSKKTKDEASKDIAESFKAISKSPLFKKMFPNIKSVGAFQKFMLGLNLSSSAVNQKDQLDPSAVEIFNKGGLTVYQVKEQSETVKDLVETLKVGEAASEATFSAELRKLVIRIEGTPDPEVISEFLSNQFRDLTTFSRFEEEVVKVAVRSELDFPPVIQTSPEEVQDYIQTQLQTIKALEKEGRNKEAEALYTDLADIVSSFQITETGKLTSSSHLIEGITRANNQVKQATTELDKLNAILNLESLIREARRVSTGIEHPKFKSARGEALFVYDVKRVLESAPGDPIRLERGRQITGNYLGDGDGHKVGSYNVRQTVVELKRYQAALERGENPSLKEVLYNTGNQRDEQLGVFLHIYAHPEKAVLTILELSPVKFLAIQKKIDAIQERMEQEVKAGLLNLPPPLKEFFNMDRSSKEAFAQAIQNFGQKLNKEGYKGYARGGDELAILAQDPHYASMIGILVDLLNERVEDGETIAFPGGVGFAQITPNADFETLSKKNAAALKLTKLLKDVPVEKAPIEKYVYVYGTPLTRSVAKAVIQGAIYQLNSASSGTDLAKLQDLALEEDEAMWEAAFSEARTLQTSWKRIQAQLRTINTAFQQNVTPGNLPYVLAQIRSNPKARAHYFDLLNDQTNLTKAQRNALNTLLNITVTSKHDIDQSLKTELDPELVKDILDEIKAGKGVLSQAYRFTEKALLPGLNHLRALLGYPSLQKEQIEDRIVPFVEELPLIAILALGGIVPYLLARTFFVLGHTAFFNRILYNLGWVSERELQYREANSGIQNTFVPLVISLIASLPLLFNPVSIAIGYVALLGIVSHVGLNSLITYTKSPLSKANIRAVKDQAFEFVDQSVALYQNKQIEKLSVDIGRFLIFIETRLNNGNLDAQAILQVLNYLNSKIPVAELTKDVRKRYTELYNRASAEELDVQAIQNLGETVVQKFTTVEFETQARKLKAEHPYELDINTQMVQFSSEGNYVIGFNFENETPFIAIYNKDGMPKKIKLKTGAKYTIGRETKNSIRFQDEKISRRHLTFTITAEKKVFITDNGSANGTFIRDVVDTSFETIAPEVEAPVEKSVKVKKRAPVAKVPRLVVKEVTRQNRGKSPTNEDATFTLSLKNGITVSAIFDGVGGSDSGDVASSTATEVFKEQLGILSSAASLTEENVKDILRNVFEQTRQKIDQIVETRPEIATTNTTATVSISFTNEKGERKVVIANAGDGRGYVFRQDQSLELLTEDDSLLRSLANDWFAEGLFESAQPSLAERTRVGLAQAEVVEDAQRALYQLYQIQKDKTILKAIGRETILRYHNLYGRNPRGKNILPNLAASLIARLAPIYGEAIGETMADYQKLKKAIDKETNQTTLDNLYQQTYTLTIDLLEQAIENEGPEFFLPILANNYFNLRNVITTNLRSATDQNLAFYTTVLKPGDRLILTSDGVHDNLTSKQIQSVLQQAAPGDAAIGLVNAAYNSKSLEDPKAEGNRKDDDITATEETFLGIETEAPIREVITTLASTVPSVNRALVREESTVIVEVATLYTLLEQLKTIISTEQIASEDLIEAEGWVDAANESIEAYFSLYSRQLAQSGPFHLKEIDRLRKKTDMPAVFSKRQLDTTFNYIRKNPVSKEEIAIVEMQALQSPNVRRQYYEVLKSRTDSVAQGLLSAIKRAARKANTEIDRLLLEQIKEETEKKPELPFSLDFIQQLKKAVIDSEPVQQLKDGDSRQIFIYDSFNVGKERYTLLQDPGSDGIYLYSYLENQLKRYNSNKVNAGIVIGKALLTREGQGFRLQGNGTEGEEVALFRPTVQNRKVLLGKGVLLPVFQLATLIVTLPIHLFSGERLFSRSSFRESLYQAEEKYKDFIENFLVPVLEEGGLLFLLATLGPIGYILGRVVFIFAHVLNPVTRAEEQAQNTMDDISAIFKILFLPALISIVSIIPIIQFAATIQTVFLVGLITHILANVFVTYTATNLQKAVLGKVNQSSLNYLNDILKDSSVSATTKLNLLMTQLATLNLDEQTAFFTQNRGLLSQLRFDAQRAAEKDLKTEINLVHFTVLTFLNAAGDLGPMSQIMSIKEGTIEQKTKGSWGVHWTNYLLNPGKRKDESLIENILMTLIKNEGFGKLTNGQTQSENQKLIYPAVLRQLQERAKEERLLYENRLNELNGQLLSKIYDSIRLQTQYKSLPLGIFISKLLRNEFNLHREYPTLYRYFLQKYLQNEEGRKTLFSEIGSIVASAEQAEIKRQTPQFQELIQKTKNGELIEQNVRSLIHTLKSGDIFRIGKHYVQVDITSDNQVNLLIFNSEADTKPMTSAKNIFSHKTAVTLGRASTSDLLISDVRASKSHAILKWENNTLQLIDSSSTNGTFVPQPLPVIDEKTARDAAEALKTLDEALEEAKPAESAFEDLLEMMNSGDAEFKNVQQEVEKSVLLNQGSFFSIDDYFFYVKRISDQGVEMDLYDKAKTRNKVKSFTLFSDDQFSTSIGRSDQSDITLPSPHVSRLHATLQFTNGELRLSDTGSHNGTFLIQDRYADIEDLGGTIASVVQQPYQMGEGTRRGFKGFQDIIKGSKPGLYAGMPAKEYWPRPYWAEWMGGGDIPSQHWKLHVAATLNPESDAALAVAITEFLREQNVAHKIHRHDYVVDHVEREEGKREGLRQTLKLITVYPPGKYTNEQMEEAVDEYGKDHPTVKKMEEENRLFQREQATKIAVAIELLAESLKLSKNPKPIQGEKPIKRDGTGFVHMRYATTGKGYFEDPREGIPYAKAITSESRSDYFIPGWEGDLAPEVREAYNREKGIEPEPSVEQQLEAEQKELMTSPLWKVVRENINNPNQPVPEQEDKTVRQIAEELIAQAELLKGKLTQENEKEENEKITSLLATLVRFSNPFKRVLTIWNKIEADKLGPEPEGTPAPAPEEQAPVLLPVLRAETGLAVVTEERSETENALMNQAETLNRALQQLDQAQRQLATGLQDLRYKAHVDPDRYQQEYSQAYFNAVGLIQIGLLRIKELKETFIQELGQIGHFDLEEKALSVNRPLTEEEVTLLNDLFKNLVAIQAKAEQFIAVPFKPAYSQVINQQLNSEYTRYLLIYGSPVVADVKQYTDLLNSGLPEQNRLPFMRTYVNRWQSTTPMREALLRRVQEVSRQMDPTLPFSVELEKIEAALITINEQVRLYQREIETQALQTAVLQRVEQATRLLNQALEAKTVQSTAQLIQQAKALYNQAEEVIFQDRLDQIGLFQARFGPLQTTFFQTRQQAEQRIVDIIKLRVRQAESRLELIQTNPEAPTELLSATKTRLEVAEELSTQIQSLYTRLSNIIKTTEITSLRTQQNGLRELFEANSELIAYMRTAEARKQERALYEQLIEKGKANFLLQRTQAALAGNIPEERLQNGQTRIDVATQALADVAALHTEVEEAANQHQYDWIEELLQSIRTTEGQLRAHVKELQETSGQRFILKEQSLEEMKNIKDQIEKGLTNFFLLDHSALLTYVKNAKTRFAQTNEDVQAYSLKIDADFSQNWQAAITAYEQSLDKLQEALLTSIIDNVITPFESDITYGSVADNADQELSSGETRRERAKYLLALGLGIDHLIKNIESVYGEDFRNDYGLLSSRVAVKNSRLRFILRLWEGIDKINEINGLLTLAEQASNLRLTQNLLIQAQEELQNVGSLNFNNNLLSDSNYTFAWNLFVEKYNARVIVIKEKINAPIKALNTKFAQLKYSRDWAFVDQDPNDPEETHWGAMNKTRLTLAKELQQQMQTLQEKVAQRESEMGEAYVGELPDKIREAQDEIAKHLNSLNRAVLRAKAPKPQTQKVKAVEKVVQQKETPTHALLRQAGLVPGVADPSLGLAQIENLNQLIQKINKRLNAIQRKLVTETLTTSQQQELTLIYKTFSALQKPATTLPEEAQNRLKRFYQQNRGATFYAGVVSEEIRDRDDIENSAYNLVRRIFGRLIIDGIQNPRNSKNSSEQIIWINRALKEVVDRYKVIIEERGANRLKRQVRYVNDIKKEFQKAKKVIDEVQKLATQYEAVMTQLQDDSTGLNQLAGSYQTFTATITAISLALENVGVNVYPPETTDERGRVTSPGRETLGRKIIQLRAQVDAALEQVALPRELIHIRQEFDLLVSKIEPIEETPNWKKIQTALKAIKTFRYDAAVIRSLNTRISDWTKQIPKSRRSEEEKVKAFNRLAQLTQLINKALGDEYLALDPIEAALAQYKQQLEAAKPARFFQPIGVYQTPTVNELLDSFQSEEDLKNFVDQFAKDMTNRPQEKDEDLNERKGLYVELITENPKWAERHLEAINQLGAVLSLNAQLKRRGTVVQILELKELLETKISDSAFALDYRDVQDGDFDTLEDYEKIKAALEKTLALYNGYGFPPTSDVVKWAAKELNNYLVSLIQAPYSKRKELNPWFWFYFNSVNLLPEKVLQQVSQVADVYRQRLGEIDPEDALDGLDASLLFLSEAETKAQRLKIKDVLRLRRLRKDQNFVTFIALKQFQNRLAEEIGAHRQAKANGIALIVPQTPAPVKKLTFEEIEARTEKVIPLFNQTTAELKERIKRAIVNQASAQKEMELFLQEANKGLVPKNQPAYNEFYRIILKQYPQLLLQQLRLFQQMFQLNPAQRELLSVAATIAVENVEEELLLDIATLQVEQSAQARELYFARFYEQTQSSRQEDFLNNIIAIAQAGFAENDRRILNILQQTEQTVKPETTASAPTEAPILASTSVTTEAPTKEWGAAVRVSEEPVAKKAEPTTETHRQRALKSEQVKELQQFLGKVIDKSSDPSRIYSTIQGKALITPSEGDLRNQDLSRYYEEVLAIGIYSDLVKLLLALSPNQVEDEFLQEKLIAEQAHLKQKAIALNVLAQETERLLYDKMGYLYTAGAEAEIPGLVLAIDTSHFPLTNQGLIDKEQLHPDIRKLLESSQRNLNVVLFSVQQNGNRNIEDVKQALKLENISTENIQDIYTAEGLNRQSTDTQINSFVENVIVTAGLKFSALPESVIFMTTEENHKNIFSRALQEFMLYLVANPGEATYYVDEALAESYRELTGGALPAKLKFVPELRFDSNSIDKLKEAEQATQRAA